MKHGDENYVGLARMHMRTCTRCGAVINISMREQHEEWHRRIEDATFGGCPA